MCRIHVPAYLSLSEPTPSLQPHNTLEKAAEKAGIVEHLVCHDLRRGYLQDVAHLPEARVRGAASRAVADSAGHSGLALSEGVAASHDNQATPPIRFKSVKRLRTHKILSSESPDSVKQDYRNAASMFEDKGDIIELVRVPLAGGKKQGKKRPAPAGEPPVYPRRPRARDYNDLYYEGLEGLD